MSIFPFIIFDASNLWIKYREEGYVWDTARAIVRSDTDAVFEVVCRDYKPSSQVKYICFLGEKKLRKFPKTIAKKDLKPYIDKEIESKARRLVLEEEKKEFERKVSDTIKQIKQQMK